MTPFQQAQRFVGIHEQKEPGKDHPLIQFALSLCTGFTVDSPDETPWCSAFVNLICWLLALPRSKSAAARSWLNVGARIALADATPGFDVVILQRGEGPQPGPEVLTAQGHVGFFAGWQDDRVLVLGGNQGDAVNISSYPKARVLAVQRLLV
jgi:uncharacterized protein (TIGR02594 family)